MPSLLILMPIAAIIAFNIPRKMRMDQFAGAVVLLLAALQAGAVIALPIEQWLTLSSPLDRFFNLRLSVDNLSLVMLLSISIVIAASILTAMATITDPDRRFNFINLTLLSAAGMNGIVMVRDLFSLYVFLEIAAASSFILIAFNKDRDSLEGAFKYLIISGIATLMMLAGIAMVLLVSADTSFYVIRHALKSASAGTLIPTALAFFIGGMLIKGGLVPFHAWLPDAYASAPPAGSVLLAGIVTKTTGIYVLIRVCTGILTLDNSIKSILLVTGCLSILIGAVLALRQNDYKRMLAYSSISQMGYIVIGLGAGSSLGIAGAVFHLFNHAIFKSQLFVNAAAVETSTGSRNMDRLGGLAGRMPYTGISSIIGFLSTAGIPPFAGFWSKLMIIIALWESGNQAVAGIAVFGSLLTLAYFLLMQRRMFFGELAAGLEQIKEAPIGLVIPAIALATITVGVGLFFPAMLNSFILPVRGLLW